MASKKEAGEIRTAAEWQKSKGTDPAMFAGAMALRGYATDKPLTEVDYQKAINAFANIEVGLCPLDK